MNTTTTLFKNIRFYVLVGTGIITLLVVSILDRIVPTETLYYIRLGQIFGLLALIYWYVSLLVSPLSKVIAPQPWLTTLLFARRAIGVSAAYFAVLHAIVAITKQLGGFGGLFGLPERFTLALILGGIALLVLLAMAATSFDAVIKKMTYKRWKWLQRTGYFAGILVILHIWMIGTHTEFLSWQLTAFLALVILFGLEAIRISKQLAKKYAELAPKDIIVTLTVTIWVILSGLLLVLPSLIPRHHGSEHTNTKEMNHE